MMWLTISLTFIQLFTFSHGDETCYTQGECINSPYIDYIHTESAQECRYECLATEDCTVFTWYNSNNLCLGFSECFDFSNSTCSDCVSGLKTCSEPFCFEKGRCLGTMLDVKHSETENDCLNLCKMTPTCSWFTFDERFYECSLLDGCSSVDASCSSCQSGATTCQEKKEFTKMMVLNGFSTRKNVMVDLSSPNTTCLDPPQFDDVTQSSEQSPAFMYRDKVHICGGYPGKRDCFYYDRQDWAWIKTMSMMEERYGFDVVKLGFEEFWILGGSAPGGSPKDTSEILRDGIFYPGPKLPFGLTHYCAVKVNSSFLFIGGGGVMSDSVSNETFYSNASFLVDIHSNAWIELPEWNGARFAPSCGLFRDDDDNSFVVAAGGIDEEEMFRNDTDILDLTTLTWTPGPDLPYAHAYSNLGVAQFRDYFLLTGGFARGQGYVVVYDDVLKFDKTLQWKDLPQSILHRSDHSVILVPDEFAECN